MKSRQILLIVVLGLSTLISSAAGQDYNEDVWRAIELWRRGEIAAYGWNAEAEASPISAGETEPLICQCVARMSSEENHASCVSDPVDPAWLSEPGVPQCIVRQ